MKPLKVINLIWLLVKILFSKGNVFIYYHVVGGAKDCPLEVECIEKRKTMLGDKFTIY